MKRRVSFFQMIAGILCMLALYLLVSLLLYVIPSLLIYAALSSWTDWGWPLCVGISLALPGLVITCIDSFSDFRNWRRQKLKLRKET